MFPYCIGENIIIWISVLYSAIIIIIETINLTTNIAINNIVGKCIGKLILLYKYVI